MPPTAAISALLGRVRRRIRRHYALVAGLYLLSGLSATAVLAPLWAAASGSGSAALWLVVIAAVVGTLAAILGGVLWPRRQYHTDRQVAVWIGRQVPRLASDLLSSVELAASTDPGGRHPTSSQLTRALVASTADRLGRVDHHDLVPRAPLLRPARAVLCAVALVGLCLVLAPGRVAAGWTSMIDRPPSGRFGNAQQSAEPLVGDLDITLHFPDYTGREPARIPSTSGDLRVLPGTEVVIETRALMPVEKAFIVFDGEERPPDMELSRDGELLRGRLIASEPIRYRFLVTAVGGDRKVEATPRTIEIEPDREPQVELYAPADELEVSDKKRIELAMVAEDDFGLAKAELVWSDGQTPRRIPIDMGPAPEMGKARKSAQSKWLWDLADVPLEPGAKISYMVEVFDNDAVSGSKVGRSKTYTLRVLSPRERHDHMIDGQRQLFEKMLRALGNRLTADNDLAAHREMHEQTASMVIELGTLMAALDKDPLAAKGLMEVLDGMKDRLGKLSSKESRLLDRLPRQGPAPAKMSGRLAASHAAHVTELEDDVLALADWIDRQEMESALAITDEIKGHRERLDRLFEEYRRTGDESIREEIERELRAMEARLAELQSRQGQMAADVLDQFVNREALASQADEDCLGDVRKLLAAGDVEAAEARMRECGQDMDEATAKMEQALGDLRGDKFSEEQRKFEALRSELADLAKEQGDIAEAASEMQQRYAEAAAELMKDELDKRRPALEELADKLRKRIDAVPKAGIGQFAVEELEAVDKRMDDIDRMLGKGDLAEALAMAREAEAGLEVVEAELQDAVADEHDRRFRRSAERSLDKLERAMPLARKLVSELEKATPSPSRILSKKDLRDLDKLRRRQQNAEQKAQRLGERAQQMADELPGEAGKQMGERLGEAGTKMGRSAQRMRARDPSGARQEAREAAEVLSKAQEEAAGAARQQQSMGRSGLRDEPVRIPGSDEYRAPEKFREDILDAMKKDQGPTPYRDMIKRYYEELIR